MSQSHLERIADLLPMDQRENWFRISSRFENANKNTEDEIWLLAELIAMVGLATASREAVKTDLSEELPEKGTREIAEKQRQISASLERQIKSLSDTKAIQDSPPNGPIAPLLIILILLQAAVCWLLVKLFLYLEISFMPNF